MTSATDGDSTRLSVRPGERLDRDFVLRLAMAVPDQALSALLVPDLGRGDRLAHSLARAGLGVAVEVDQAAPEATERRNSAMRITARAASSPWCRLPPPAR